MLSASPSENLAPPGEGARSSTNDDWQSPLSKQPRNLSWTPDPRHRAATIESRRSIGYDRAGDIPAAGATDGNRRQPAARPAATCRKGADP